MTVVRKPADGAKKKGMMAGLKSAFDLLWSTLTNLHAHAARKLVHGGQTRTLKSLASAIVSTAVSRKLANR